MFIMVNDQVSVEDLLKGIIIASGNDACVALAEGIAGSEENFAEMMNEKADEIGMTGTNFTNSSGLTIPTIYQLLGYSFNVEMFNKNYPDYYEIFKKKLLLGIEQAVILLNKVIEIPYYIKMLELMVLNWISSGRKIFTRKSMKKERRLTVASGFPNKNLRSSESLKLLNWGFRNSNTFEFQKKRHFLN